MGKINDFKYRRYIVSIIIISALFEALFNVLQIDSKKFIEIICNFFGIVGGSWGAYKNICNRDEKAQKMKRVYERIEKALGKDQETPGLVFHIIYFFLQKIIEFLYPLYSCSGVKGYILILALFFTPLFGVMNPVKAANEVGKEMISLISEMYEFEEKNEKEQLQQGEQEKKNKELKNSQEKKSAQGIEEETEKVIENEEPNPKPKKYQFILDDADGDYRLSANIEDIIFFWETPEGDLDKSVKEFFVSLLSMKKRNVPVSYLMGKDGQTVWDYQDAEKRFESKISEAKDISTYEEWIKEAPHSSELDEIIEGRELLGMSCVDDGQGNYEIWWNLANNYQKYATEFEEQTENEEAILYYYSMSIYSCIEALQYDIDHEKQSMILNYIRGRYEDIGYYKSEVPTEYKKRAEQISDCLREMNIH